MKYIFLSLLFIPHLLSAGTITLNSFIHATEKKYGLPRGILKAVIAVESKGAAHAINHDDGTQSQKAKGIKVKSIGLMQIQLATARSVGFKGKPGELMRPEVNIEYGARYLNKWFEKYNDISRALTCFNGGPGSFGCRKSVYTPYVGKVLNALYE